MSTNTYKCPNCDGPLKFSPESQDFTCEYCLSHFSPSEIGEINKDKQSTEVIKEEVVDKKSGELTQKEILVYKCPACGAEVITDNTTAATFCHYCHNPVILEGKLQGEFSPDGVIPFKKTKKEVTEEFLKWVKTKKFIPKAFFNKSQIEKLSGVYYPYWITDYKVNANIDAVGHTVRVWRVGDTEYTETSVYNISRGGDLTINDISNNALRSADSKLAEYVLPFKYSDVKEFNTGYLSGFLAEKRDIEIDSLKASVRNTMEEYAKNSLRNTVSGYDYVNVRSCDVKINEENWKYLLLPVWMLTYKKSNNEIFYYAVNGQTGEVCGKLPIDNSKLALLFGGLFLGCSLLTFLGGWFFI